MTGLSTQPQCIDAVLTYQRVKCHVDTQKLHSPLKKVPLRCLMESDSNILDQHSIPDIRIAGKKSLCLSYAFKIAANVVSVLFLDSFYHDHIPVEALLIFGLYRRIC